MDAVVDFAYPTPMIVIAEMLGVPLEDRSDFIRWARFIASDLTPQLSNQSVENQEIDCYFRRLIVERRQTSRDDLISTLIQAQVDGESLSNDDQDFLEDLAEIIWNSQEYSSQGRASTALPLPPAQL
jgi:cytochrome P450